MFCFALLGLTHICFLFFLLPGVAILSFAYAKRTHKAQELSIAQLDPAILGLYLALLGLLAWSMAQGMRHSASVLLAPKMWGKHTGNEGAACCTGLVIEKV